MTIDMIKAQFNIQSLDLQYSVDDKGEKVVTLNPTTGEETTWVRYWDNTQRLGISMTEKTMDLIDANRNRADLFANEEEKTSETSGKDYTHVYVGIRANMAKSF